MALLRRLILVGLSILVAAWFLLPSTGLCQVSPAEIPNPQLKALEKANLDKLMELNHEISDLKFPFKFVLTRYVGLDPKDQVGADTRGIEFVNFHNRRVLKVTGNYNAAFNSDLLTQNERANRVFDEGVVPILSLLPKYFPENSPFDAFGFEISYHVRTHNKQFGYEGKESLVLVLSKPDVSAYLTQPKESGRQEILDRSEIYLDGKEFGLALGQRKAFDVAELEKSDHSHPVQAETISGQARTKETEPAPATVVPNIKSEMRTPLESEIITPHVQSKEPDPAPATKGSDIRLASLFRDTQPGLRLPSSVKPASVSAVSPLPAAPAAAPAVTPIDLDAVQKKFQPQLDLLTKDGLAHFHFVSYAAASLGLFHNQIYVQLTLRNPNLFDRNATSIYKRAAQSFDLFLAPQLKGILAKIPSDQEIAGVDVTVLDEFTRSASSSSPEALEFVCPLSPLRQFADADITNQDLLNQSVVLVNGVRVALNLQQVE